MSIEYEKNSRGHKIDIKEELEGKGGRHLECSN